MKKRVLAVLLSCIMLAGLIPFSVSAAEYTGTWRSTYVEINGELYAGEDVLDSELEIVLHADGSGSMDFGDEDGAFDIVYYIEDGYIELYDGEDTLDGEIDGSEMCLYIPNDEDEIWVCLEPQGSAAVPESSHASASASQGSASFTDVKSSDWFYGDVTDVQRYGIINGVGNNRFDPQGTLSLAQAITMAARTHAYLRGQTIENYGSVWYQPYVDFAAQKGICSAGEFGTNYNAPCSRLTMALLFARIVPADTKSVLNDIKTLPDVTYSSKTAPVYDLYRYGILTGSDAYGSFNPDKSITRAETAAILNRVLDTGKRKTVHLAEKPAQLSLPETSFVFSSGAGGWGTEINLHADGSFDGQFFDMDMGLATVYICTFHGTFGEIKAVDQYTYSMKVTSLKTEETKKEWTEDQIHYIAVEVPYGFEGDGRFNLYLPGKPTSGLNEDFRSWYLAWGTLPNALSGYALHNLSEGYGFFESMY